MFKCHFCHRELNVRDPGVHQYTKGWVKNRSGGGGHGISLPERESKWAHGHCIERVIKGTFAQSSLFESEPPPREPAPTNAAFDNHGLFQHICNVCGADAPYGMGVNMREGDLGLWYCRRHRP